MEFLVSKINGPTRPPAEIYRRRCIHLSRDHPWVSRFRFSCVPDHMIGFRHTNQLLQNRSQSSLSCQTAPNGSPTWKTPLCRRPIERGVIFTLYCSQSLRPWESMFIRLPDKVPSDQHACLVWLHHNMIQSDVAWR